MYIKYDCTLQMTYYKRLNKYSFFYLSIPVVINKESKVNLPLNFFKENFNNKYSQPPFKAHCHTQNTKNTLRVHPLILNFFSSDVSIIISNQSELFLLCNGCYFESFSCKFCEEIFEHFTVKICKNHLWCVVHD